jgi:ATP-dependent RNA helicase DDX24/MAK5
MDPAHVVHVPSRVPRSLKRRRRVPADKPIKKRRTYADGALDDLDWRVVFRLSEAGVHEEGGMLLLEEAEGVNVLYEETEAGKRVKFRKVRDTSDQCLLHSIKISLGT